MTPSRIDKQSNIIRKVDMKHLRVLSIIGLAAAASPTWANLVFPQSPLYLEQRADLIVVGTPVSAALAGGGVTLSLSVGRALKGSAASGSVVSAQWMPGAPGPAPAAAPAAALVGTGIWFLQQSSSGWIVLPAIAGSGSLSLSYYPAPAGPILSAYAYGQGASPSDKVAAELGSAIEAANGAYNMQFYQLQYGLIDLLNSPYVSLLFTRLSNSTLISRQIIGLAGLIREGSPAAITASAQSSSAFAAYPIENGILLLSIRTFFRATDTASVAALGNAATGATASATAMREAAGHALAAVHTAATLPYLAALLNDQDPKLRAAAVGGIGSFANGLATQTPANNASLAYLQYPASAPYMTAETKANFALGTLAIGPNEAAFLSYWSQWWSQNKASLGF